LQILAVTSINAHKTQGTGDPEAGTLILSCPAALSLASPKMARGTTTMEVRADGVAVITISNPPVNALSLDGITPKLVPFSADALIFGITPKLFPFPADALIFLSTWFLLGDHRGECSRWINRSSLRL
jgi:hypothetical protein